MEALATAAQERRRASYAVPQCATFSRVAVNWPRRAPKIVSEMLGHSTVAITLDVYSHVTPAMHREAARVMDVLS